MKKILIGLFILTNMAFAKNGYVDVNVLLIKKYPSDESVKFGYYKKYTEISVLETHDGIDNDDKWYLTNRGYVRAKYVILNEDLPTILTPQEVDTTKNAIQLAVYPKRAKFSLKEGIKKLQGENNVFVEETSRAKVLYLVNFKSYRDAVNKLESINAFKGFVTRIKLKNIANTQVENKVEKKEIHVKNEELKKAPKAIKKEKEVVRKMIVNDVPESVMMDDDAEINEIMKKIDNESYAKNKKTIQKPKIEKVEPKVVKKDVVKPKVASKQEKFITLKTTTKVQTKTDYNMNRELSKTLENSLIELDRL